MAQSYKANATLTLQSNVPQVLAQISRALGVLDARINTSARNLNVVLGRMAALGPASSGIRQAAAAMAGLHGASLNAAASQAGVTGAVAGANRALGLQTAALTRNATAATNAASAIRAAVAAMGSYATVRVPPTINPMRGAGAGGAGGRSDRLGEMAALGQVARAGQGVVGRILGDAGSVQTEQALLRAQTGRMRPDQGMDAAAFGAALMARAIETNSLVRGTTTAQNLATGNELRTVLGGQPGALGMIVRLLPEFQLVAQALGRASGQEPERLAGQLGGALGLRGSFYNQTTGDPDPERGMRELEMAGRMMFAYRGRRVNPQELELFQRRARVAGERMDAEAYFGGWTASLIQNLSGNVAGTALNAATRQIVNGIMPNAQADFMKRYGLLAPNARAARVPETEIAALLQRGEIDEETAGRLRTGAAARFNRRAIVNSDLFATRPDLYFEWLNRHLAGQGIRTQDERDAFSNALGSTNTARQLFSFGLNPQAIRADIEAVGAVGPGALRQFLDEGFVASLSGFQAGITNLSGALGNGALDDAIRVMDQLTAAMNRFGAWARENPESARELVNVGIGLTALATAGALFAAGSLAMSGLGAMVAATGLPALASALGAYAAGGAAAVGLSGAIALLTRLATAASGMGAFLYMLRPGETNGGAGSVPGMSRELEELRRANPGYYDRMDRGNGATPRSPTERLPSFNPPVLIPRDQLRPDQLGLFGGGGSNLANFVPPSSRETTIRVPVSLDGRVLTEVVTRHMERDLSRPSASTARFDGRYALPSPDMA